MEEVDVLLLRVHIPLSVVHLRAKLVLWNDWLLVGVNERRVGVIEVLRGLVLVYQCLELISLKRLMPSHWIPYQRILSLIEWLISRLRLVVSLLIVQRNVLLVVWLREEGHLLLEKLGRHLVLLLIAPLVRVLQRLVLVVVQRLTLRNIPHTVKVVGIH